MLRTREAYKFGAAAVLVLILFSSAAAQGDGGFAGAFLRMGLGARAISMGGAHVGVADDGYAAYYNPAGLPFLTERHFSTSYSFLSLDRQFHFVSYSQSLKPTAGLSLYWIGAGTDAIDGRDFSGRQIGEMSEGMNAFGLSFANRFHPRLSVGLSFKLIEHGMDLAGDKISASDLAFDVGMLVKPFGNLVVGLELKDYKGSLTWNTKDIFSLGSTRTDSLPYIIEMGVSYEFGGALLAAAAFEFNQYQEERLRIGAEYRAGEMYTVRLGADDMHPTFGAGLRFDLKPGGSVANDMDYTLLLGRVGEGETHIFSWAFRF